MSAYGRKADHLGASATGPNIAVFEQDKSASPESAQAEWDTRQLLKPSALLHWERRVSCVKIHATS